MIQLRNVSKVYKTKAGRNVVLDDISVSIPPRRGLGIIGRNGCGKSTLLRIIGGAEQPTAGDVIRRGRVSWPLGFAGGFNGSLTGEENCRFVARIYGLQYDHVIDKTRAFAEIGDYFFMPVRTYSSGMRARVAFGLSMAIDFDMYLVDEITAVGDKLFRKKCRAAFDERRERAGLIMVSHEPQILTEYCDECALLDGGKLWVYDSVAEAMSAYEERVPA